MWVILRHHNEYGQYGGYFVAIFTEEPIHSPNGHFGRQFDEAVWYTKVQIEIDKMYLEESPIHNYQINDKPILKVFKD